MNKTKTKLRCVTIDPWAVKALSKLGVHEWGGMGNTYASVADVMAIAGGSKEVLVEVLQLEGNAAAVGEIRTDVSLHLGQQQPEQQGCGTGYRHTHRPWLPIRTGSRSI